MPYGGLNPAEKFCTRCGESKLKDEHFDRDSSKPDGYKGVCKQCRAEQHEAKKDKELAHTLKALDQKIVATLAKAKQGGSDIPHIAELYQTLMRGFGGLEGFQSHYLGNYIASEPGSQIRERMLGNVLRMGEAVSDSKKVEMPIDLMSDQDLDREIERRQGTSKIIMGSVAKDESIPVEEPSDLEEEIPDGTDSWEDDDD